MKPALHAGGAWSVQAMQQFTDPVVVEDIKMRARAGIDIGGVFIGMHMRPVCVPIHNENTKSAAQMSPWHATAPSSSEAKEHSTKNPAKSINVFAHKRAVLHRSNR